MPSALAVFVDTDVLRCAQDPRAPGNQQRASCWLAACRRSTGGRIGTPVLNDPYFNLRRTAPSLAADDCRALVRRYRAWNLCAVDATAVEIAWRLQDGTMRDYCDALMVAAAQPQGCSVLLTEDLQQGRQFDSVDILNRFITGPEWLDNAGTAPAAA